MTLPDYPVDEIVYCSRCGNEDATMCSVVDCSVADHKESILFDRRRAIAEHFELATAMQQYELQGCALLDSGASAGTTSDNVLQAMHDAYRADGDGGIYSTKLEKSNMSMVIANGDIVKVDYQVPIQPIEESPFAGRGYQVHVNANNPRNNAPMLIGTDFLKGHRCIVDFELGYLIYKDDPTTVHHLRFARNGHTLLMPITRDQCEKFYYKTHIGDSHDTTFKTTVASLAQTTSG